MVGYVSKSKRWESRPAADPAELWAGIRAGDAEALEQLFCLFYSPLFSYGCRLVAHPAPVKDAIQELFFTLWNKRRHINEAHSVKSYLFHSLRRIILRSLRRQQSRADRNRNYVELFGEPLDNVEELMVHFETRREQKQQLARALGALSSRQRETLFLKFYEGLSNSEIACVMGIRPQSVYNHVSTAIGRLQDFVQTGR